jgi:D-alanyl-D-alanine carboxypeptidase
MGATMFVRKPHLLGVMLTAFVAAAGIPSSADAAAQSARDRALTKSVRGAVREASIPGAIVGVWQKGKTPYVRAFGVRNTASERRMSRNLHMRIGSQTKTFTVTALLQLVGKGKVGLDDPIGKYVPNVANGDTITLRELASMTSGLPSYTQTESFVDDLMRDPQRSFAPQELLDYVAGAPPLFAPGMGFSYSNTNTILIGLVVEKVSGQSLPRYIKQHILKPLRMNHTTFATDAAFPSPHAQGYTEQTADGKIANATDWNPSWGWAAGSMISTVHDLRIWARHLATGKRLLKPAVQRERADSLKETQPGAASAYGIGMFSVAGWVGHNGSLPGYQTVAVHRPANRTTVVVLTNTDISYEGRATGTIVGQAVTSVLTPKHVYDFPATR